MKLLTILLAFYLLLLPCLPCSDSDAAVINNSTTTAKIDSAINHSEHGQEDEACNPFCNCICCGQILIPNFHLTKLTVSPTMRLVKKQYALTNVSQSSSFFATIWQPPRLS